MSDLKSTIYHHFFTRKRHFILGKPPLVIKKAKETFFISGEFKDNKPWFKVDHGTVNIFFTDVDDIVEFIETDKEKK